MLKSLRIRNFVLIEALDLEFGPGVCLLTGETGAGKSIMVDALAAALGGRVALDLVRAGAHKAGVEATFGRPAAGWPADLEALLDDEGIEPEIAGELTLVREISPRGARCRIEGQQVTQAVLKRVGRSLVDVVSQHEHQRLMDPGFHLDLLDEFGGLGGLRAEVTAAHADWATLRAERRALVEGARARAQQQDFWRFQLEEIQAAELRESAEDEALKAERLRLVHAEQLRFACEAAYQGLYAGDNGPSLYDQLNRTVQSLCGQSSYDAKLGEAGTTLEGVQATIKDVASDLRRHLDMLEADPARLADVEERLDQLALLDRKYGPGLAQVMAHALWLTEQLAEVTNADARLAALDAAATQAEQRLVKACERLSEARHGAASELEAAVVRQLHDLELPNARFVVALRPYETPPLRRATGQELAEFEIAMNPGEPPRPLAKTASGGEMARVMLSLETVLAGLAAIPSLVFDEVDSGISGRAAQAVAEKLAGLGRTFQILCITHLPTVAAMADQHVHLAKHVIEGRTHVVATTLDDLARVRELAQLASGSPAPAALRHAEELLARARTYKAGIAITTQGVDTGRAGIEGKKAGARGRATKVAGAH